MVLIEDTEPHPSINEYSLEESVAAYLIVVVELVGVVVASLVHWPEPHPSQAFLHSFEPPSSESLIDEKHRMPP